MRKIIYKKDTKGKIRFLSISTEDNFVVQESGVMGTASPVTNKSACVAKNVGRSNATTPQEQAVAEANAKLADKLSTGYFETVEEAETSGGSDFLLPMLAHDYKKHADKITYPCYVQPKLDGMRALGSYEQLMSRTGKLISTLKHIDLSKILGLTLDGELYLHGSSFQENMRAIKKFRTGVTEQVKYHVYDIVSDLPFPERYLLLIEAVKGNPNIELVHTARINNEEELKFHHQLFISQGYEGTIIRHGDTSYEVNKRSTSLIKYKDFLDETYEVIDIVPSEKRPEQGNVKCQLNELLYYTLDGNGDVNNISDVEFKGAIHGYAPFKCGMKFSHAIREDMLARKKSFIGLKAEVRFFEFNDSGIPRFPVCVGFRLDK